VADRVRLIRNSRATGRPAHSRDRVLVIGLGRFGSAVAHELMALGNEVMGLDVNARAVQDHAELLTHVLEADTTDRAVLVQLGIKDFDLAIVGIGSDIEASLLTTAALLDAGVPNVWAKAVTEAHGQILERVGAHHVVYPERDMGRRLAHLVNGRMLDWFQLDDNFAMAETVAPDELVGKTLADAGIRARYGVTVVSIKPVGGHFTYATPDTMIQPGDILVVAGERAASETFAHLSS
jgi:trk system potassium uptake protein